MLDVALWADVHVPLLDASSSTLDEQLAGLAELERIVREANAAMAAVIAEMPETRDKTAAIARACKVSAGEALQRKKVAAVCDSFARAAELLGRGLVSPEHLASLERALGVEGAESLLDRAVVESPEEFRCTVEQFRLAAEHGEDTVKRQRAQRHLRFSDGPDGMVAFRGLLPPVDGKNFREKLAVLVNAKWRKDHPQRARTLGGHGGDPHDQRMADALLDMAGIRPFYDDPTPTCDDSDCQEHSPGSGSTHATDAPTGDASARADVDEADVAEADVAEDRHPGPIRDPDLSDPSQAQWTGTVVNSSKPAVVIVFNVDRWAATLIGKGPVPVTPSLFDQTRADLYYLFENTEGEVLKFGRARRYPTALQRLAIMARDQRCVYAGCEVWADRCQIHHINEVHLDSGETDVDKMAPLCGPHHPHTHDNDYVLERTPSGVVNVLERGSRELVEAGRRRSRL